jgi:starch-binding outer membrane protein, SusD/RagB family
MSLTKRIPGIVGPVLALVLAGACSSLNIVDSNDPDQRRALSDPTSVENVGVGAFQTWYLTGQGGFGEDENPGLTLAVMARSHAAMWNNFNIRFYTGCTNANWDVYTTATSGTCGPQTEGPYYPRVEWQNNPASAQRTQIQAYWYGYYASLSGANAVVAAIRNGLIIEDSANTKMVETMGVLTEALDWSALALAYDQAFIVDYNTDLNTLQFSTAADVRDAAAAKFDEAIALATANTFTVPGKYFGSPANAYTNTRIVQIANTFAARNLAYFARNAAQNAAVDWTRVAGYASKGISSGTAFDLTFHQDGCNTWCDFLKVWTNDVTTMRIHTRVAHQMDPASQPDPWDITLNHNPNSADKRLGDGTYRGDAGYASSVLDANPDTTGNGGYDYVWVVGQEFGNKTRGSWHQSAIGQVRYDSFPGCGDNPQGTGAPGVLDAPMVLAAENDLLWAEGLIRGTPDLATAATLINYTRVGPDRLGRPRGGLTPATAGDANLLDELLYEQDVELPGSNIAPFYNQRRLDRLEPLTPHEFPVPAKELGVDQLPLYTCGGAANPDGSCQAHAALVAALVTDAPRVWADMQRRTWENMHHYGLKGSRHE